MSDTSAGRVGRPEAATASHLARLERVYHAAPTNGLMPARLHLDPGRATVRMEVAAGHLQAVGSVHGMVLFKVLDEASFYAANSLVEDVFLTTAGMHVQFVRPVEGGVLVATAEVVHAARSSFLVDAEVRDPAGELVARSTGTFVRTATALPAFGGTPSGAAAAPGREQ
jgi:uncharacterized protein (TIGR00369 family)